MIELRGFNYKYPDNNNHWFYKECFVAQDWGPWVVKFKDHATKFAKSYEEYNDKSKNQVALYNDAKGIASKSISGYWLDHHCTILSKLETKLKNAEAAPDKNAAE